MTTTCGAAVMAFLLVLGGASASSRAMADGQPTAGGVLTYALSSDPSTHDCHAGDGFPTIHALAPHYSTLLRIDPAHYPQIIGDIADSWEIEEDGLTYNFRLHPGILFHDGTPLTAADVKASFDRIRKPPPGVTSVRQSLFEDVDSIEAPDELTVVFRLKRRNTAFLALLASPFNCIYSAALLTSDPDYPAKHVMGSGPFRFVEYVAGAKWVGRRFEKYFRQGLPYLDGFEAYVVPGAAIMTAIEGGQVMADFAGISPAERDALMKSMGSRIKFQENARLSNFQLTFNTERKPFDDTRVRRALSLAIDRWSAESTLRRTTSAGLIGGLLRPGSAMARSSQALERLPGFSRYAAASKDEARRLLRQAGHDDLRFTLTNLSIPNPFDAIGVYAIDQWRQVGITVTQEILPVARWNSARFSGRFDVITDFVGEFIDEPTLQLAHYLSHDRTSANLSRVIDRTLDDLYERQMRSADFAERQRLVLAFEQRVLEQAYVAPISWSYRIVPLAAQVMGYTTTPSIHANQDLADIWLKQ
jgi:peptide/nickel transport system substrate-binding protein